MSNTNTGQQSSNQKTRRKQHFSSGGESLGSRNSSGKQEKRKTDVEPKRTNWFCIKFTLFFLSFMQNLAKLETCISKAIIVQNSAKIL